MIGVLMTLGLGKRVAQAIGYVALPLLILAAGALAIHAYGDRRYDAGVADTDRQWQAASDALVEQAAVAATAADAAADTRAADYAQAVATEKEKIDDAARNHSSALDVLFGAERVR